RELAHPAISPFFSITTLYRPAGPFRGPSGGYSGPPAAGRPPGALRAKSGPKPGPGASGAKTVADGESRPYLGGGGCRGHGSEAFGLGRPRAFEQAARGFGQMAGSRFCILGFGRRKSEKSKTDVSHLLVQGADGPRSGLSRERTRVPGSYPVATDTPPYLARPGSPGGQAVLTPNPTPPPFSRYSHQDAAGRIYEGRFPLIRAQNTKPATSALAVFRRTRVGCAWRGTSGKRLPSPATG
ncbi:hypothetical protein PG995_012602, partial [Apiospora arundinis]